MADFRTMSEFPIDSMIEIAFGLISMFKSLIASRISSENGDPLFVK